MMTTDDLSRKNRHRATVKRPVMWTPTPIGWITLWILASVIPILPYAQPLWQNAMADTPYAYLVWIPVFAFLWAVWSLLRLDAYIDDAELNGIVGIILIVLAGSLLFAGMNSWANLFLGNSVGLIIWPLWSLGLAWLMFGVGVTVRLLRPLSYLLLAWPPLYAWIVSVTNPILDTLANFIFHLVAKPGYCIQPTSSYGEYTISHGTQWVTVAVTSVCSGSDSFLAMVIMLPIILLVFEGSAFKKFLLIVLAGILAICMNLLRLFILVISVHAIGSNFTFGTLHPVLGVLLFILIISVLAALGNFMGLKGRSITTTQQLQTPGWTRGSLTLFAMAIMTTLLWPIYGWAAGSFGVPIPVSSSNLSSLMPAVPSYARNLLGTFDEAAILGPGSYGRAFAYSTPQGDYTMAEEWWTTNLSTLQGYGVNNCLLFHGYTILGKQTFAIRPGVAADAFAILLPSNQAGGMRDAFEDITYVYAVKYHGQRAFIRAEFMTPIRYQVQSHSPLLTAMPLALAEQVGNRTGNSALTSLRTTERQHMNAFTTFVRSFADTSMESVGNVGSA